MGRAPGAKPPPRTQHGEHVRGERETQTTDETGELAAHRNRLARRTKPR